jgi:hypothetical protein
VEEKVMAGTNVIQWLERPIMTRQIPLAGGKEGGQCDDSSFAQVYAGRGITGGGGNWTISLGAISCLTPAPGGDRKISVTATPTSDALTDDVPRPVMLVARTSGALLTIWALNPAGQPMAEVEFSWHVIVEGTFVG